MIAYAQNLVDEGITYLKVQRINQAPFAPDGKNIYVDNKDAGKVGGGSCKCPDGQVYEVGNIGNTCDLLGCPPPGIIVGTPCDTAKKGIHKTVNCASIEAINFNRYGDYTDLSKYPAGDSAVINYFFLLK